MVPAEALVPGDIVLLESGDKIPADLRLVDAKNLRTEEAALTGESVPMTRPLTRCRRRQPLGTVRGWHSPEPLWQQGGPPGL